MDNKFRVVSLDKITWTVQVYIFHVGSTGQPVGWIDIKQSPGFDCPETAIYWAKNIWK